ncbi:hydroxyacid dehydrogenase [Propionibacterium australiense]|uniref:Hydroxyacid dehydrogenase n=1 Tax=Propionibacterium australiense TaxID=119981 RepID=A0A383S5C0_9ACTN|nr:hydroxyacid dehydrogenase [Propionibacterium australiense]RLP10691.1 hydroxyacid dehydrogenase [Propionibacterium australiense]RLP12985.1 hydroxyacid dehydrogenase [Propionibacterium australiense]SYZ32901.1 D-isomer specific 2-hydroxyacid dehydrogenases NAD-binding signature [Propionibacterium australiense]VEH91044.1 D-3-phosphoglycerate dehydrogenase [Propionibacterium australiense]
MSWKILLPQEIMAEGTKYLEDAGHTLIRGRGFETADVLADMKEHQPDAMIVRITPITREVIESNPNLKVVVRHGAGFDVLDVQACHDNGVQALYAPVANSTSVAETALLLILECSRNVLRLRKTWVEDYYKAKLKIRKSTINGKTIGIIGCGNIGSRLARRALALEMNVLCYDPYKPAKDFPAGVEVVRDLDRIFTESDYVSLHTPATSITRDMVNKEKLALMKPTAFLINTARGAVVNEQDLYAACKDGTIMGAGLDAIRKEPVDPDNPLLTLDNVIIYPHIGGNTIEAAHRASFFSAMGVQEVYEGKEPTWPINDIDYETAPTYDDVVVPDTKKAGMFDF